MRKCKTCEYKDGNFCKRYPPVIVPVDVHVDYYYPYVVNDDWCGEYKKIYVQEESNYSGLNF